MTRGKRNRPGLQRAIQIRGQPIDDNSERQWTYDASQSGRSSKQKPSGGDQKDRSHDEMAELECQIPRSGPRGIRTGRAADIPCHAEVDGADGPDEGVDGQRGPRRRGGGSMQGLSTEHELGTLV